MSVLLGLHVSHCQVETCLLNEKILYEKYGHNAFHFHRGLGIVSSHGKRLLLITGLLNLLGHSGEHLI